MWCQKIRQTKKPGLGVRDKSELRRIRQTYLLFSCLAYSVSISQTGISQTCHFHVSDLFHGPSLSGLFHTQLRKEVSGLFQGQMSGLFQGPVCLSHVSPLWWKGGGFPLPYTITFRPPRLIFLGHIRTQIWVEILAMASMLHGVKISSQLLSALAHNFKKHGSAVVVWRHSSNLRDFPKCCGA